MKKYILFYEAISSKGISTIKNHCDITCDEIKSSKDLTSIAEKIKKENNYIKCNITGAMKID